MKPGRARPGCERAGSEIAVDWRRRLVSEESLQRWRSLEVAGIVVGAVNDVFDLLDRVPVRIGLEQLARQGKHEPGYLVLAAYGPSIYLCGTIPRINHSWSRRVLSSAWIRGATDFSLALLR